MPDIQTHMWTEIEFLRHDFVIKCILFDFFFLRDIQTLNVWIFNIQIDMYNWNSVLKMEELEFIFLSIIYYIIVYKPL